MHPRLAVSLDKTKRNGLSNRDYFIENVRAQFLFRSRNVSSFEGLRLWGLKQLQLAARRRHEATVPLPRGSREIRVSRDSSYRDSSFQ